MDIKSELQKYLKQMEEESTLDNTEILKICNAYILAISLLNSEPSKEYLQYIKPLIPKMNLPEYLNAILNNIILEKINN